MQQRGKCSTTRVSALQLLKIIPMLQFTKHNIKWLTWFILLVSSLSPNRVCPALVYKQQRKIPTGIQKCIFHCPLLFISSALQNCPKFLTLWIVIIKVHKYLCTEMGHAQYPVFHIYCVWLQNIPIMYDSLLQRQKLKTWIKFFVQCHTSNKQ